MDENPPLTLVSALIRIESVLIPFEVGASSVLGRGKGREDAGADEGAKHTGS